MLSKIVLVDVEAAGPCPGLFPMISFGAVLFDKEGKFDQTFYGQLIPDEPRYQSAALDSIGITWKECFDNGRPANVVMKEFDDWLRENVGSKPMFYSDNNGFDYQFINFYFWKYLERNPFGHSSTNIGSLYKGMRNSVFENFKHLRVTKHSHHPIDDSIGNAEALLAMCKFGLKLG